MYCHYVNHLKARKRNEKYNMCLIKHINILQILTGKDKPEPKFEDISTAMADFRKPEGFEKPEPCKPSVTNHFFTAKFDGRTTSSMAYKPFPVKRYELPIWAKKPVYKRPEGGMIVNSLYMVSAFCNFIFCWRRETHLCFMFKYTVFSIQYIFIFIVT